MAKRQKDGEKEGERPASSSPLFLSTDAFALLPSPLFAVDVESGVWAGGKKKKGCHFFPIQLAAALSLSLSSRPDSFCPSDPLTRR